MPISCYVICRCSLGCRKLIYCLRATPTSTLLPLSVSKPPPFPASNRDEPQSEASFRSFFRPSIHPSIESAPHSRNTASSTATTTSTTTPLLLLQLNTTRLHPHTRSPSASFAFSSPRSLILRLRLFNILAWTDAAAQSNQSNQSRATKATARNTHTPYSNEPAPPPCPPATRPCTTTTTTIHH